MTSMTRSPFLRAAAWGLLSLCTETQVQAGLTRFYFGIHNIAIRQNTGPKTSQEKGRAQAGGTAADGTSEATIGGLQPNRKARRRGDRGSVLVPRGKRQQGDIPGLLNRAGKAALMRGANAGEPPRNNLAALGHKALQQADIAVRDRVDLLRAELADLLAAEELAAAAGSA
jgi:hypothetical protein